jgi:hypothetical protein
MHGDAIMLSVSFFYASIVRSGDMSLYCLLHDTLFPKTASSREIFKRGTGQEKFFAAL